MGYFKLDYDGLLIGTFLLLVLVVFSLLAAWFGISAYFAVGERRGYRRRIARTSVSYAGIGLAGYVMVMAYLARSGPPLTRGGPSTGPDIIDWAIVPALVVFVLGCFRLKRRRAGDRSGEQRAAANKS